MKAVQAVALAAICALGLTGCGNQDTEDEAAAPQATEAQVAAPSETQAAVSGPNVIEVTAAGLTFDGPSEIPAGWTTIRFLNSSGMTHLAMIDVLPEGVDVWRVKREVVVPFQDYLDAVNAGDMDAANAAFGRFPDWFGDMTFMGGPGLLAPGHTSEVTVNLQPGNYLLECYVKTNGVWHNYTPDPDTLAMHLPFTVVPSDAETAPPEANATLAITNDGFEIVDGALQRGHNQIKVEFREQQAFENFLGNDVHVVALRNEGDLERASAWMDWRPAEGLQTPAPVLFLGGLEDMPAGRVGYFTVNLDPGDYALMMEAPDPVSHGWYLPFSVE